MPQQNYPIIIKQEGLGKCLRTEETNLGKKEIYKSYLELTQIYENKYRISIFDNPAFHKDPKERILYEGRDLKIAKEAYHEFMAVNNKAKEILTHKIFSRN